MPKQLLIDLLTKYEVPFTLEQVNILLGFMDDTLSSNKKFNLTAIKEEKEFVEKMIFDSVLPLSFLDLNERKVIDIGTGAGFPGLALKILSPKCHMTLLDATKKKVDRLDLYSKSIGMSCKCVNARAEQFSRLHKEEYNYVTARAVSSLSILLELVSPLLKIGGRFIAYKGKTYLDEIKESKNALKILNMEIVDVKTFILPNTNEERAIILIEKKDTTPSKYPREYSQISKRPL